MNTESQRLEYLDWMRGLAAAIMLQGHVLDGWVRPQDRAGEWFWLSQFLGGLPAPIFLFLVGLSLALVLHRMSQKGATKVELVKKVVRRGGWILLLAYAFRFEQFLMWYPSSQWTDIFRVDTLNGIAACTILVGLLAIVFETRRANTLALSLATAAFVFVTPFAYPHWARIIPGFVLAYINGNGHPAYFSLFPWAAFTLAGITVGYMLIQARERQSEARFFSFIAVAGVCAYAIGLAMDLFPIFRYGFFDYSLTSPHFLLIRLGLVLLILYGAYKWSTRKGSKQWSPLRVLGQASLLVYWVHVELVYGRPFHQFSQALDIRDAASQLLWLVPLMIGLAAVRGIHRTWRKHAVKTAVDRLDAVVAGDSLASGIRELRQGS